MVNKAQIKIKTFTLGFNLKNINKSGFLLVLHVIFLLAYTASSAQENYVANPKDIKMCVNYGVASVSIVGKNISKIKTFKILKDGKETKDILVKVTKTDPDLKDIIGLKLFVVNNKIGPGKYSLDWDYDRNLVLFDLPITIVNCPTNPKVDVIRNKYVQFEKYTESNIYQAIIQNLNPAKIPKYNSNELLLSDPTVRRNLMLMAFAEEVTSSTPKIRDWFPKSIGAIGGTLVLVGENMDMIKEVRLGDKPLTRLNVPEVQNQLFRPGVSWAVFQLPNEPIQGDLTVINFNTNLQFAVERGYKTVDQKGTQWPATRSTLISAVYANSGSSISSTIENGIGDAMRTIQFSFLIEYVPGNVINSFMIKDSIPLLQNKAGEALSAIGVYSFLDASYNFGFFGNAVLVTMTKYINNPNPTTSPEIGEVNFEVNSSTYQSTQSAQNNELKRTTTLSLKYNTLKRYIIENTTQLNRIFDFQNFHAWGTVSGISTNIDGSDPVEVGQIVVENDIAFRIASGPFGTEGSWASSAFRMPQGWLLDKMIWSEKRDYSESDPNKMAFSGQAIAAGFTTYPSYFSSLINTFATGNCLEIADQYYSPSSGQAGWYSCGREWRSPQTIRLYSATGVKGYPCGQRCFEYSDCIPVSIGLSLDDERRMTYFRGACPFEPATVMREPTSCQIVKGTVISLGSTTSNNNKLRVLQKLEKVEFLGPHVGNFNEMLSNIYLYNSSTFRTQSGDRPTEEYTGPYNALSRYKTSTVDYYMQPLR